MPSNNYIKSLLFTLIGLTAIYAALVALNVINPGCGYAPKAKQTQAKIVLGKIFAYEKDIHASTGSYTLELPQDAAPASQELNGFSVALVICRDGKPVKKVFSPSSDSSKDNQFVKEARAFLESLNEIDLCSGKRDGYLAYTAARLDINDPKVPLDIWRMDETKKVENLSIGI